MDSELFHSLQSALADTYQLERELGRGGMATVYLAQEAQHPRKVALKVLRPELAGAMTRGRFLREIRISSDLTHPNILPLLNSGTIPPTDHSPALPYFTMPYVEGETLADRLRREKQLPLDVALGIAREVLAALGYAHGRGVIHRDIKPANILLMDGHAVVADFGIARAVKESVDPGAITSAGLVIGTPAYMSPEQAGGEMELDGRSDLYSLACVLYEMLAGEPPFTGPTPHAVLARHRMDPPPSLRTVRASVPPSVEQAVMRTLQKSPADRFSTAEDFVAALEDGAVTAPSMPPGRRSALWPALFVVGIVAVALVAWRVWATRPAPLDVNKVVVFPLGETPAGSMQEGTGVVVALMIGSALEFTDPLVWIDAEPRLSVAARRDANGLTAAESRRITREAGARWFLDGNVLRQGDSATVILRLNDAAGDSVVARASATRNAAEAAQAGLAAVIQILPRLLAPGQQMADLSVLANRRPAAVALWLQGEREYRSFNFAKALEFAQRAIREDSSLAVAAIRGAQAANWMNEFPDFRQLAELALKNIALLPGRMSPFVRGLHAYGIGQADSAVSWLHEALRASPDWTEAHMTLGEVYYHLLPSVPGQLDTLAEAEFTAAAADSGFSPPRFHLAELAIRSGDTTRAKQAVFAFLQLAEGEASSAQRTQLRLMLACARAGRSGVVWPAEAAADILEALSAATMLAAGGAYPGCAEDGFRAVFDLPEAPLGYRWGAFLGLQGLLAAEGRTSELRALIDSAIAAGLDIADQVYVLDALADVGVEAEAAAVAAHTRQELTEERSPVVVWLAGEWQAHMGDEAGTVAIRDELARRAASDGKRTTGQYAAVLAAEVALIRGDTAGAIRGLGNAMEFARSDDLNWGLGEPLAPSRLLLAKLLLATHQPQQAIWVASIFDHTQPIIFLAYLPASLRLRREAALALGRDAEARRYAQRLRLLEPDSVQGSTSPSSTGGGL